MILTLSHGLVTVANAGASRAVVISETADGFVATPITNDHNTENEKEVKRINNLGGIVEQKDGVGPH